MSNFLLDDAALKLLKDKIDLKNGNISHFGCLFQHKHFSNLTISPDGMINLSLSKDSSNDAFHITGQFVRIGYTAWITAKDSCWIAEYDKEGKVLNANEDVSCRRGQMMAISIADILKHHLKTDAPEGEKKKTTTTVETTIDKEQLLMDKLLKKCVKVESISSPPNLSNILGTVHLSSIIPFLKSEQKQGRNFSNYCKQFLLFPCGAFLKSVRKEDNKTKEKFFETILETDEVISKVIQGLSTPALAQRLLRHFLFNESLNLQLDDDYMNELFVFDQPLSVPDVLLKFYTMDQDEDYLVAHKVMMKEPSTAEQKLLLTTYKSGEFAFDNLEQVTEGFGSRNAPPIWALRNIKIRSWKRRHLYHLQGEYVICKGHTDYIHKKTAYRRFKYLSTKTDKQLAPAKFLDYYSHGGYKHHGRHPDTKSEQVDFFNSYVDDFRVVDTPYQGKEEEDDEEEEEII